MIAIALVLAATLNTAKIEELIGLKGKLDEKEGAFKVSYPRSDIAPTAAGVKLTPPLGLTAWASFTGGGAHTMVMGDMVLTEDQVNAAMSAALDSGLEVTALHNHFFWDSPKVINTMGVNTWAALAGSPEKAVVDGDFAMLESEMQEILKTLRHANINIVAIHSHMAGEQPRILFLHYWGVGPAEQLAKAVMSAVAKTGAK